MTDEEKQIPLEEYLRIFEELRQSISSKSTLNSLEYTCKIILEREDCDEKLKEECLQGLEEAQAEISKRRLELEECIKSINREEEKKDPRWKEYLDCILAYEEDRAEVWIESRRSDWTGYWCGTPEILERMELEDDFKREEKRRLELIEECIKLMNREEEKYSKWIDNIMKEQENRRRSWWGRMHWKKLIGLRDSLKSEINDFEYYQYDFDFLESECFVVPPSVEYKCKCEDLIEVCEIILASEDCWSEHIKEECRQDVKDAKSKINEGLYGDIVRYSKALKIKLTLEELRNF